MYVTSEPTHHTSPSSLMYPLGNFRFLFCTCNQNMSSYSSLESISLNKSNSGGILPSNPWLLGEAMHSASYSQKGASAEDLL